MRDISLILVPLLTMNKCYEVAGHRFRVGIADESPLWGMMGQYSPFETACSDDVLFSMDVVPSLPDKALTPVYTEAPSEPDQARIEIYRTPDGWRIEMAPVSKARRCCILDATEDFSSAMLWIEPERKTALFSVNNSLMILYAFMTATRGTLEMHSSVVTRDGKGYMFLGKSGTGKSTHSRQWLESMPGVELLNDDNPVIRVSDDGEVRVYGSPWSGKTPCYRKADAPVGAIVRIRQCPDNKITRLSPVESYASVYSSCSGLKFHKEMADGLHSTIEKVALGVKCFVLDCRPDHDAARVCYEAVR